jgi:hypothetical protein
MNIWQHVSELSPIEYILHQYVAMDKGKMQQIKTNMEIYLHVILSIMLITLQIYKFVNVRQHKQP